jgi:hypothetical protein
MTGYPLRGLGPADHAEIQDRVALVRAAKRVKARTMVEITGDPSLTDRELDTVLEPIDGARTRERLGRAPS